MRRELDREGYRAFLRETTEGILNKAVENVLYDLADLVAREKCKYCQLNMGVHPLCKGLCFAL